MAEKKVQEHAFKRIASDVKGGDIPSLVLLHGKEQYLVEWALDLIASKFVNDAMRAFDYVSLRDETATLDAVTEACETLSMLSPRRVVVVTGFSPLEGKRQKGFSEADETQLAEYIRNIPDSTILILTCETPDKRKKLYKACEAAGRVYDFTTLSEKDLTAFIVKRFKTAGKICKQSVINEIIQNSGYYHKETDYNLYNLENDLKKIIAHSEGEEITGSDVLGVISGNLESYIFALMDSISTGKKGEAFKLLYSILGKGENVYKILSMVISQYELTLDVKELREQGYLPADIVKTLGIHEFRVKKALSIGEKYTTASLRKTLTRAYETDRNIKTGLIGQNLALEMLIATI